MLGVAHGFGLFKFFQDEMWRWNRTILRVEMELLCQVSWAIKNRSTDYSRYNRRAQSGQNGKCCTRFLAKGIGCELIKFFQDGRHRWNCYVKLFGRLRIARLITVATIGGRKAGKMENVAQGF